MRRDGVVPARSAAQGRYPGFCGRGPTTPRRRRTWSPSRRAGPSAAIHSDASSRARVWRTLVSGELLVAPAPAYSSGGVTGGRRGAGGALGRGRRAAPSCGAATLVGGGG